jgi:hypothetical protein
MTSILLNQKTKKKKTEEQIEIEHASLLTNEFVEQ